MSNAGQYTVADWENDITLARDAKIDGFVLNVARDEATNGASLANAFVGIHADAEPPSRSHRRRRTSRHRRRAATG